MQRLFRAVEFGPGKLFTYWRTREQADGYQRQRERECPAASVWIEEINFRGEVV
jgi:hypothetical protein